MFMLLRICGYMRFEWCHKADHFFVRYREKEYPADGKFWIPSAGYFMAFYLCEHTPVTTLFDS